MTLVLLFQLGNQLINVEVFVLHEVNHDLSTRSVDISFAKLVNSLQVLKRHRLSYFLVGKDFLEVLFSEIELSAEQFL